nr:C40 family peptidase [Flexivirga aerilata]
MAVAEQAKSLVVKPKAKKKPATQAKSTPRKQNTARTTAAAQTRTEQASASTRTQVRPRTSSVSRSQVRTVATTTQRSTYTPRTQPTQRPVSQPKAQPTVPSTSGVVAIAQRYLGTPYVYGGNTPAGFDCSGFTSYVFAQAGKSIPRTATAQMFASTKVSNPQPGDLVFYGSASYAYHVGIYMGNGMMVAAPKPGDVVKIQAVYGNPVAYGRL